MVVSRRTGTVSIIAARQSLRDMPGSAVRKTGSRSWFRQAHGLPSVGLPRHLKSRGHRPERYCMNTAESEYVSSLHESIELRDVPLDLATLVQTELAIGFDLAQALRVDEVALPAVETRGLPAFERPLQSAAREIPLLNKAPLVRTLGKLTLETSTQ